VIPVVRVGGPNPQAIRTLTSTDVVGIEGIASKGAQVNKIVFTYDGAKDVTKMEFYHDATKLFTLNFTMDADKDVTQIERTEP